MTNLPNIDWLDDPDGIDADVQQDWEDWVEAREEMIRDRASDHGGMDWSGDIDSIRTRERERRAGLHSPEKAA